MPDSGPHPREVLFGSAVPPKPLPVCDHYSGVEGRMRKSLALQAELSEAAGLRPGEALFDVTLDCEDGAPVGGEAEHAELVAALASSPANARDRVGVRVHPHGHPAFEAELETLLGRAGPRLAYVMVPKPTDLADAQSACDAIDAAARRAGLRQPPPVHVLIETHGALRDAMAIAALPAIESLSFGLMDYVAEFRGALPAAAMGARQQFSHPVVMRAKLEIAIAAHTHGKTPAHGVVTEFRDRAALAEAARKAARELVYTRMWSIHPDQIPVIVAAFAPDADEVALAAEVLIAGQEAAWAPVRHHHAGEDRLHDRASYRHFWQVLVRAHGSGTLRDAGVRQRFFGAPQ